MGLSELILRVSSKTHGVLASLRNTNAPTDSDAPIVRRVDEKIQELARRLSEEKSAKQRQDAWHRFTSENGYQHDFSGLVFTETALESLAFTDCNFSQCRFVNCRLNGVHWNGCVAHEAEFIGCSGHPTFSNCKFDRASFRECSFRDTSFNLSVLTDAVFERCDLRHAMLDKCELKRADFRSVQFDSRTSLRELESTEGWRIDSHSLACLASDSGLTVGNRQDLIPRDDAAELRKQFSGVPGAIHYISLAIFVAPYLWFVMSRWAQARFLTPSPESISLLEATGRYFVNGGVNWQLGWQPDWVMLPVSIIILFYNGARFRLLLKASALEASERITGVPVKFSMNSAPRWYWLYEITKWGFYIHLILVGLKTWHFLEMRIPLS